MEEKMNVGISSSHEPVKGFYRNDSMRDIPLEKIVPNPEQPRILFSKSDIRTLGESIRSKGLLERIVVRPLLDGTFMLVSGERRWRAAKLIGLKEIPATIRDVSDEDLHLIAFMHNIGRRAHTHFEIFRALVKEIDAGRTQQELAQALGKSQAWVSQYLSLRNLAPELQELIEHGKETVRIPFQIARDLTNFENHEFQKKEWERIKGLTPKVQKNTVNRSIERQRSFANTRTTPSPRVKEGECLKRRKDKAREITHTVDAFLAFLRGLGDVNDPVLHNTLRTLSSLDLERLEENADEVVQNLQKFSKLLNKINNQ